MSKHRYRWWGFVRRMVRDYRGLKKTYDDLHEQTVAASLSAMPSGGGANRSTENAALRLLPKDDQDVYDAVTRAVEAISTQTFGREKIALIRYIYWGREQRTVNAAANALHISVRTAQRWHAQFIRQVAVCFGFSVKDGVPEP